MEGPESTSHVVGKALGFVIPSENLAESPFNMIHSDSMCMQANHLKYEEREDLAVAGGTGSFAFCSRGSRICGIK
ncbi:hypothetical protein Dimus_025597 [Dionaea muscipula]